MTVRRLQPRQRGITLVELLLAISVVLVVIGVAIATWALTRNSQMAYQAESNIMAMRGVVTSMRANGYSGMSAAVVINAGKAPHNMANGTNLVSPWGKSVTIAPVAVRGVPDAGYTLTYEDMPKEICPDIVGVLVEQFERVDIEGDTIKDSLAVPAVADRGIPAIISACQAAESVDVVFLSL